MDHRVFSRLFWVGLAVPASAMAGLVPHVGDVGVVFENGRIVTTVVEEHDEHGRGGGLGLPQRVFDSDLGTIEFGPFGNDEPGYTSDVLPAGVKLGFNIRAELKKWNGAGFDGGLAESMQLGQFLGTPGQITRDTGAGFVGGFDFVTVDQRVSSTSTCRTCCAAQMAQAGSRTRATACTCWSWN